MFAAWFSAGVTLGGAMTLLIVAFVRSRPEFDGPDPDGPVPFGAVLDHKASVAGFAKEARNG